MASKLDDPYCTKDQPFGLRIRQARKLAGLTQARAAARVDMSLTCWNRIECGYWDPSVAYLNLLKKLASVKPYPHHQQFLQSRVTEKRQRLEAIAAAVNSTLEDLLPEEADYVKDQTINPVEGTS